MCYFLFINYDTVALITCKLSRCFWFETSVLGGENIFCEFPEDL